MALADGQVQIRDLLMGPGTDYRVLSDTDPWSLTVRADQSDSRAWNHGSWSGAEWAQERIVPMTVAIDTNTPGDWLDLHQPLMAAFSPVGDVTADVEMRFGWGGREYLLFGRPRMVEPQVRTAGSGSALTRCGFVATDPLIYSGTLHATGAVPLPVQAGGLSVPFTVPFFIGGTLLGGSAELVNDGTAPSGITLRIDGPVDEPRVSVQHPDGTVNTLRFDLTILAGQFLLVNTAARTAFLQGLPQSSRRGQTAAEPDWPLAQPGMNTLRFGASDFDEGTVTASWRDSWW